MVGLRIGLLVLWSARTFTSPAHQTFDNYLTSEILRSRNHKRAVNLVRLKTETYVDIQQKRERGENAYEPQFRQFLRMVSLTCHFIRGFYMT